MQEASRDLSTQIAELEEKNRQALEEVQEVVSSLSDLRHGRFAQTATGEDITEELIASLKQLEASCATTSGG
jgi:centromere-localized protein 2